MKPILIANWKMNLGLHVAVHEAKNIHKRAVEGVELVICPSFTAFSELQRMLPELTLGAQNMHYESAGNFTGEVSVTQVKRFAQYVIIGHSERRQYNHEDDTIINQKVKSALAHDLVPVLAVGENLEERKAGQTQKVIREQLEKDLRDCRITEETEMVIAYEPVWAISGKDISRVATSEEIQKVADLIKELLVSRFGSGAKSIRIIYGGSTNAKNCREIFEIENISGSLVGSASLEARSFIKIAKILRGVKNV
ncbi:triose-phosphate isomerase [Patescibacteria group bacterium]